MFTYRFLKHQFSHIIGSIHNICLMPFCNVLDQLSCSALELPHHNHSEQESKALQQKDALSRVNDSTPLQELLQLQTCFTFSYKYLHPANTLKQVHGNIKDC